MSLIGFVLGLNAYHIYDRHPPGLARHKRGGGAPRSYHAHGREGAFDGLRNLAQFQLFDTAHEVDVAGVAQPIEQALDPAVSVV
jgi:hypothetical protein